MPTASTARKRASKTASRKPISARAATRAKLVSRIARDTGIATGYIAQGGTTAMRNVVDQVDFPQFVGNLINGTFQAIVSSSIKQMEAYADLVRNVAASVDGFSKDDVTAQQTRDRLVSRFPELDTSNSSSSGSSDDPPKVRRRTKPGRFTPKDRRRLVAKALLLGINRIVVTNGRVR